MTPKEAYNILDHAQAYLIESRSDGPFFNDAQYDHRAYQKACMLLAFGKEMAKRVKTPTP